MLTSSSQYLHPDYLQPLPTTLDAKKSPLALLAQTCSSIGKDSTPSKAIIPPIEKKDVGKHTPEKSGSTDSKKSTTDDKKDSGREHSKSSHRSSVPPKDVPPLVPISNSSDEHSRSPPPAIESRKSSSSSSPAVTSVIQHPISATTPTSNNQSNSRISVSCGNMLLEVNHQESSSGVLKPSSSQPSSTSSLTSSPYSSHSASSFKHGHHPFAYAAAGMSGYPSSLPLPLLGHHGVPIDSLASSSAYHNALSAHASLGLPGAAALKYGASSSVSPYVAYARVRTPAGGSTLVPICRDPYCTNCQLTLQNAHLSSTCTAAGCAQCAHEKALTAASFPSSSYGLPSGYPLHPGFTSSALAGVSAANPAYLGSSLYPHSMLAAAHGVPYVCNWVAGSEYCGKRFSSSEELLQHLRTHTSVSDAALTSPYSFGLPSASALAACHGHLGAPGSLSPNSLRRNYPLSLSPVSNMLGASRYHPYKSPLASVPSVPSSALSHSALAAYYSPYNIYGQRIGAAAVP